MDPQTADQQVDDAVFQQSYIPRSLQEFHDAEETAEKVKAGDYSMLGSNLLAKRPAKLDDFLKDIPKMDFLLTPPTTPSASNASTSTLIAGGSGTSCTRGKSAVNQHDTITENDNDYHLHDTLANEQDTEHDTEVEESDTDISDHESETDSLELDSDQDEMTMEERQQLKQAAREERQLVKQTEKEDRKLHKQVVKEEKRLKRQSKIPKSVKKRKQKASLDKKRR